MTRICVDCGSTLGASADDAALAAGFGAACARRGLGMVYGGGNVGLIGALADAALAAGGEVIGVTFLTSEHDSMLTVGTEVESLLDDILTTRHVRLPKPIERVPPEQLDSDAPLA